MDAFDLFKKLRAGVKFDLKRFGNDAVRCQIIKEDENQSFSKSTCAEINNSDTLRVLKKNKKRKRKTKLNDAESSGKRPKHDNIKQQQNDGIESEEEIRLTSSLKSTDKVKARQERKNKKKKNQLLTKNLNARKREQINHFRKEHRIYVWGEDVSDPIEAFSQLVADYEVDEVILEEIMNSNYTTPTPIQMQAIPIMLNRREILACAPTGSGKTIAFLIPILHHLKVPKKGGCRALIVEPTRELVKQVYSECCRLSERLKFRVHKIDKANKDIKRFNANSALNFDILVTTPDRLIELLKQDPPILNLSKVEWLVIDESDKLFEDGKTGFRDQLAVIYKSCSSNNIRRAMFSATFASDVEEWCKLNLDNVITVSIGIRNTAVSSVKQELVFVGNEDGKLVAFRDLVKKGLTPPVLVFVQTKERADELCTELIYDGINVEAIHSNRTQLQRDNVIKSFREGKIWVLICTDVLGRGVDFKGVNLVVNYDFPPDSVSYIHRIGRTGRAGRQGKAITYFTENDAVTLRNIAQVIKNAGCPIEDYMLQLRKANKHIKRELQKRAPTRDRISTIPLYDKEKASRKKYFIKKSLKEKSGKV